VPTSKTTKQEIKPMIKTADLHVRDPFLLPIPSEGKYYLYGTGLPGGDAGFDAYRSSDLQNWEGPIEVFRRPAGFWATRNYWAPEVHAYKGRYYMLASFKANGVCRGTQILAADRPDGPFVPLAERPVTPGDWECLDGTLYIDPKGEPWMVFCHEWVQVGDGEICAMRLSRDLKTAAAKPVLLFKATDAKWVKSFTRDRPGYVTDGPFLHRTKSGALLILWSSFGKDGYATALAESASGEITGPWTNGPGPLKIKDAGHSMLFETLDGKMMISLHQPNKPRAERPVFKRVKEIDGRIELE
jgi:arabinan endo-1,5-alpha-L-arabinosidase